MTNQYDQCWQWVNQWPYNDRDSPMIHSIKDILEVKAAEHRQTCLAQWLPSDNAIDFGPITYSSCAWILTKALLSPEHPTNLFLPWHYPDENLFLPLLPLPWWDSSWKFPEWAWQKVEPLDRCHHLSVISRAAKIFKANAIIPDNYSWVYVVGIRPHIMELNTAMYGYWKKKFTALRGFLDWREALVTISSTSFWLTLWTYLPSIHSTSAICTSSTPRYP